MLNSIVRVFVPLIVGCLLSIEFFHDVDQTALTELITVTISGLYYLIVRLLEHYVSGSFGWLLGFPTPPSYLNFDDDDTSNLDEDLSE